MNEYTLSPAVRILGFLFGTTAMIAGIYIFYYVSTHVVAHNSTIPFLFIAVMMIFTGYCVIRSCQRLRIIISDSDITVRTAFKTDEIELPYIDGYRRGDKNAFYLVSKIDGKSIQIPGNFRGRKEFINWIELHYEDVDARAREAETGVLLEDERYGQTREDREAALEKAKIVGKTSVAVGFILIFWIMIFPEPYPVPVYLALAAPWVAVYLTWSFKGLLRLSSTKKSPYPSALAMMVLPVVALGVRSVRDDLYGFPATAWLTLIGVTLVFTWVSVNVLRPVIALDEGQKNMNLVGMVVFIAIYSYSLLIFVNCYYDRSQPQIYSVEVTGKHVHHGKGTTYYLQLAPWGKHQNESEETVSSSFYNSINQQDSVRIFLNRGRLGIPWYRIFHYDR